MQRTDFMKGLAAEIKRSKDPRFKAVIEWCDKIAQTLKSCNCIVEQQENHVAIVTWILLAEIRCLEEMSMDRASEPITGCTQCNESDIVVPQHRFQIDCEKNTITITAEAFDTEIWMVVENIVFEPLVLPLTVVSEALPEAEKVPT